jgi:hypothetical protein
VDVSKRRYSNNNRGFACNSREAFANPVYKYINIHKIYVLVLTVCTVDPMYSIEVTFGKGGLADGYSWYDIFFIQIFFLKG